MLFGERTGDSMNGDNRQTAKMDDEMIRQLKEQIEHIQYGSVTIVIHAGKVVQLDTNTKIRLV